MKDFPDHLGAEVAAGSRHRWFRLRLPGDCRDSQLWAERFFATQAEALDYYERRRAEHPTGRVHRPVEAQEPPTAWAVCVDPV
jgi:hypothetical protein